MSYVVCRDKKIDEYIALGTRRHFAVYMAHRFVVLANYFVSIVKINTLSTYLHGSQAHWARDILFIIFFFFSSIPKFVILFISFFSVYSVLKTPKD